MDKTLINIGGMHCASCAASIEKALKKTNGVKEASVNLATEKASVLFDPQLIVESDLKGVIEGVGFEVKQDNEAGPVAGEGEELRELHTARRRMAIAWAFTLPVIAWMSLEMFFGITPFGREVFTLIMLLLSAPVVFAIGWPTQR